MKSQFFIPENQIKESIVQHISPSGKYKLEVSEYKTLPGCWNYSQGKLINCESKEIISTIYRNYHNFPFAWVEPHKNGHSYLLCGEDYQGTSIIEIDTNKRIDYLPDSSNRGHAFCTTSFHPSPLGTSLVVCGCVWGDAYEFKVYDFEDPMDPPWIPFPIDSPKNIEFNDFSSWIDEKSCYTSQKCVVVVNKYESCKIKGKNKNDMESEEFDYISNFAKENGIEEEMYEEKESFFLWTRPELHGYAQEFITENIKKWKENSIGYDKLIDVNEVIDKMLKELSDEEKEKFSEEFKELLTLREKERMVWNVHRS